MVANELAILAHVNKRYILISNIPKFILSSGRILLHAGAPAKCDNRIEPYEWLLSNLEISFLHLSWYYESIGLLSCCQKIAKYTTVRSQSKIIWFHLPDYINPYTGVLQSNSSIGVFGVECIFYPCLITVLGVILKENVQMLFHRAWVKMWARDTMQERDNFKLKWLITFHTTSAHSVEYVSRI